MKYFCLEIMLMRSWIGHIYIHGSVGWDCRIDHPANECPGYDTKQSDGEVPVMQELWGMRSTGLLLSSQAHSGPEW